MTYTATITSASLRLRESRIIADLLLQEISNPEWKDAILEQNILQMGSRASRKRISNLLRARLEPMGEGLWRMVRDGGRELATQAAFAGALKQSRLLADFMDITMREQRALFADKLDPALWDDYIAGCRGRDPEMPQWSDSTIARLRSSVFSMLTEVGYLRDTRSLILQNVFLDDTLVVYLRNHSESYVLRCMEITK